MYHWQDPRSRGVYSHPAALPPRPAHPYANDLSGRLATVEAHLQFGAMDRSRIEEESRLRAKDLVEGIESLDEQMASFKEQVDDKFSAMGDRLAVIEQERHTRRAMFAAAGTLANSAKYLLRYVLAALLFLVLLADPATLSKAKPLLLKLIGLGGG